jgi:hypothetical protein
MTTHPGYPPLGPGAGPEAPERTSRTLPVSPAPHGAHRPKCPMCGCEEFTHESGSIDSDYGMTAHRVDIRICVSCAYVLLFSKGRSFWWNAD